MCHFPFLLDSLVHIDAAAWLTLGTILISFAFLGALFIFFGSPGIVGYVILANVTANIQVLKVALFCDGTQQIALGTVVFTSLFWAFDLLTEHRGKAYAFRVLILSFALCLLMTLWMLMTIAYPVAPLPASLAAHHAMEVLFSPAPALFAASLIAYLLSQALDIVVFTRIKSWTGQKYVWLRATVAALVGGFVDHVLFCILAWGLFAAQPLDTSTLIHAYILKAYLFRAVLALGSAPLLLLVQFFRKKGFTVIDFPWFKDREAHD